MTGRRRVNGRRGAFLLIFGVVYIAIGYSYLLPAPTSSVRRTLEWVPVPHALALVGVAWVLAGVVAVVSAFRKLPSDRLGFQALASVAFGWAGLEVLSCVLGYALRGWVSALIFALIAAAVLTVSGMPNPPHGSIR